MGTYTGEIQFNQGLAAGLPTGSQGEPLWTTDTNLLYVGDGTANHLMQGASGVLTAGSIPFIDSDGKLTEDNTNLVWDNTNKQLQLATIGSGAGILIGGDTQLYRGAANRLDLATGDSFNIVSGNFQIGGTSIFDSTRDVVTDLIPGTDSTHDLGTTADRWANLYVDNITFGGSLTTAFTAGSVVFAGTSGVLAQDNANLFWNDTNNRLGIGTNSPNFPLDVEDSGTSIAAFRGTTANAVVAIATPEVTGNLSILGFVTDNSSTSDGTTPAEIRVTITDSDPNPIKGQMAFRVNTGDSRQDALVLSEVGQAQFPFTGSSAGILVGGDTQLYRSAANHLQTPDHFSADDGLQTKTIAGTPSDTDFVIDADGTMAVDTTNHRFYFRSGATWREAGGSIVVEESDGAPSVAGVNTLVFDQDTGFTVTDNGSGQVTISATGSPLDNGNDPLNAAASSDLALTTSFQDVPGASVTLDQNGKWMVIGTFEFESSTADERVVEANVFNAGTLHTESVRVSTRETTSGVVTATVVLITDVTAQPDTAKLRARMDVAGATVNAKATNTTITAVFMIDEFAGTKVWEDNTTHINPVLNTRPVVVGTDTAPAAGVQLHVTGGAAEFSSNNLLGINYAEFDELTGDPSTPAAGDGRLYAKNDGKIYFINDAGTVTDLTASAAGGAPTNAQYLALAADATLTSERVFTAGTGLTGTDAGAGSTFTLDWDGVDVRKNSAGSVFTRPRLNFIEGSNITLTVTDDAGNGEVDITVASSSSPWTDAGTYVHPTTTTDAVTLGSSTAPGSGEILRVDGTIRVYGASNALVMDGGGDISTTGDITAGTLITNTIDGDGNSDIFFDSGLRIVHTVESGGSIDFDIGVTNEYSFGNGSANFAGNAITNMADPSNPQDAATKAYVDSITAGTFSFFLDADGSASTEITDGETISFVGGTNVTTSRSGNNITISATGGVTDHGALTGLADDDHSQYALLAGRSGGQTLLGGTATADRFDIYSLTNNAGGAGIELNGRGSSNGELNLLAGGDSTTISGRKFNLKQHNGSVFSTIFSLYESGGVSVIQAPDNDFISMNVGGTTPLIAYGSGTTAGDVALGTASTTGATKGFVWIPEVAGAPTGTPGNTLTNHRAMVYDSTNNRLYVYNSGWKSVTLS